MLSSTPTAAELITQADDIALAARMTPTAALHILVVDLQEHGECDERELEVSSTAAWQAIATRGISQPVTYSEGLQ